MSKISHIETADLMTPNVITVNMQTLVKDAITLLLKNKISAVPITDSNNRLISIVSEHDLMNFTVMGGIDKELFDFRSKMVTVDQLVTVKKKDSFKDVYKKFLTNPVRRVLVVDDSGHLLGIISRKNILRAFMIVNKYISAAE